MAKKAITCFGILMIIWLPSRSQNSLTASSQTESKQSASEIFAEVDSLLSAQDSLAIFNLIDSLLSLPEVPVSSQLGIRLAYNSNIVSTGRTLGIDKFGLSAGVAYYHKKGFYADLSGYWSREYDPDYYLTIASAGYLGNPVKWWSVMAEYSRFIYTDTGEDAYIPYKNNAGISNFFISKWITGRLDYYLYFGEKTGHRIMPGFNLNFQKRGWKGIDRIYFYPSVNVLFGSEEVTEYIPYETRPLAILLRIRRSLPLYYESTHTEFGVMNYSFSAPLSIAYRNWNFMLSYTYNIPKALPGETLGLTNSGYGTLSIIRYFNFK